MKWRHPDQLIDTIPGPNAYSIRNDFGSDAPKYSIAGRPKDNADEDLPGELSMYVCVCACACA